MSDPKKAQFDHYAGKYREMHKANIRASGEDPEYFARYKADLMASWVGSRLPASARILDFGCGIGNTIPHLHNAFPDARIDGADPSSESIRIAHENNSSARFSVIDGAQLPYEDGQFDLVLAACVFHHIAPAERDQWMKEIHRVLKPDGEAFIFEHNVLNPLTVKAVKDCPFDEDAILLPRRELTSLARRSGFQNVRARYVVFFPRSLSALRPAEPALGWVPLGAQYVVHATSR